MASLDFEKEKITFREYYASNYPLLKGAEEAFRALVSSLLAGNELFPSPVVTSRLKDREETLTKFQRKYQAGLEEHKQPYEIKDHITDLIGVRVTCYYETDIPHIHQILNDNFRVIEITDKTSSLESRDNTFGYKGLHLDLELNPERRKLPEYKQIQNFRFEVQIRTIIQHAWSELDHKIKYKKTPPADLKRDINMLAALFELADQSFVNIRLQTEERERQARAEPAPKTEELREAESQTLNLIKSKGADHFLASLQDITNIDFSTSDEEYDLDAFQFLTVAEKEFPNYSFLPDSIDTFVQAIHGLYPEFSQQQLSEALDEHLRKVLRYSVHFSNFNPFTMIRHALFLYDQDKFRSILFDMQRRNFEDWLSTGTVPSTGYAREPRW